MTCGTVEENLRNNRAVAEALAGRATTSPRTRPATPTTGSAWRDSLDPHLLDVLALAWA